MRILLWLTVFVIRRVLGMLIYVVIVAVLGRGPAGRYALMGTRMLRRITRL